MRNFCLVNLYLLFIRHQLILTWKLAEKVIKNHTSKNQVRKTIKRSFNYGWTLPTPRWKVSELYIFKVFNEDKISGTYCYCITRFKLLVRFKIASASSQVWNDIDFRFLFSLCSFHQIDFRGRCHSPPREPYSKGTLKSRSIIKLETPSYLERHV